MTEEETRPSIWITVLFVIFGFAVGIVLFAYTGLYLWAGGHGGSHEMPMMIAFPYGHIFASVSEVFVPVFAAGQYPIYGWILGQAMRRGRVGRSLLWLVGVHAAAIVVLLLMG